jgi:plasmid stabilization system protein ParE
MRTVKWTSQAEESYIATLEYWIEHNKSTSYSMKIIIEIEKLEKQIQENPYFLSRYHKSLNLYQKLFLNNRFSVFYEVDDEKITIKHFRSNRQKPL